MEFGCFALQKIENLKILNILALSLGSEKWPLASTMYGMWCSLISEPERRTYYPVRLHSSYHPRTFSIIQIYMCDFVSLTSFNVRNILLSRKTLVSAGLSQKQGYIPSDKVPLSLWGNEDWDFSSAQLLHTSQWKEGSAALVGMVEN